MLNVNDLAETHNKRTCFEIKCCKKEWRNVDLFSHNF